MFRNFKVLLIVLVVIVAAAGAYAFAAANTVEDSAAGYKASTVSGYAVTDLVYDLKSEYHVQHLSNHRSSSCCYCQNSDCSYRMERL